VVGHRLEGRTEQPGREASPRGGADELAQGGDERFEPEVEAIGGRATTEADSATVVYGSPFPPELVRRVVRSRQDEVRACYVDRLAARPSPAARVVVEWTIDAEGTVVNPRIASSTIDDAEVDRCITEVIQSLQFQPRFEGSGGTARIRYPFLFEPIEGE
jgi:TonB family protein